MAVEGELVLLLACDFPLLRHQLGVLAHGEAGARLSDGGRLRSQLSEREAFEGSEPLPERFGLLHLHEALGEALGEYDGRIGGRVRPHADAAFDLTDGDLGGDAHGCLETRATGLDQGGAGCGPGQLGADDGLARDVPVLGVSDDGAADHLVDVHAGELVAIDQPVERGGQHLQIGEVRIERVGAAERDAHSPYDGDTAKTLAHPNRSLHDSAGGAGDQTYSAAARWGAKPSDFSCAR